MVYTKQTLFKCTKRNLATRDDLPLVFLKLFTKNQLSKRQSSIKFLGILLHESLSWKEHLKFTENENAKNVGLMYKAKPYLK